MEPDDPFYCQLAKSIQAWLWVEAEVYFLYVAFMRGADQHLISVTFNHIQSFDSKLGLLNSCFALALDANSAEWKSWKQLRSRAENLNKKRNKIVHEPAILSGIASVFRTLSIGGKMISEVFNGAQEICSGV